MTLPASVVIVGGSISGLLQGLQLKRLGSNVVVLERDPSNDRHSHESGVQIGPSVVRLLEKHDATGRPSSVPAGYMSASWRQNPRWIDRLSPRHMSNWGCLYLILRANFDGLASETVPNPPGPRPSDGKADYRRGKQVTGIHHDAEKGRVHVQYLDVIDGSTGVVSADLVIGADGIHSTVRQLVQAPTRKEYAGYIAWRGTVSERLLSPETIEYFSNRLNFCLCKGTYFISYFIPTETGHVAPGARLLNWVWYFVVPEDSPDMETIFTDANGRRHFNTVPRGGVSPTLWAAQIGAYRDQMLPALREVVERSPRPFVTKVMEAEANTSRFCDDRVILVGDAFTAFRSHMGMASEQAARHCFQLDRVWNGQISHAQRDREARLYAKSMIFKNRLVGLGGLGLYVQVLLTALALLWLHASAWLGVF